MKTTILLLVSESGCTLTLKETLSAVGYTVLAAATWGGR